MRLSSDQGPTTERDKEIMKTKSYAHIVGSIMYAILYTRPDLTFAVGLVNKFLSNLGLQHWYAVKRILWYIKGAIKSCLCYQGEVL